MADAAPPFDTGTAYRIVFELRPSPDGVGFDAVFVDGDGEMVLPSGAWRKAVSVEELPEPPYEYGVEYLREGFGRVVHGPRGRHQLRVMASKPGSVLVRRRVGETEWEAAPGAVEARTRESDGGSVMRYEFPVTPDGSCACQSGSGNPARHAQDNDPVQMRAEAERLLREADLLDLGADRSLPDDFDGRREWAVLYVRRYAGNRDYLSVCDGEDAARTLFGNDSTDCAASPGERNAALALMCRSFVTNEWAEVERRDLPTPGEAVVAAFADELPF